MLRSRSFVLRGNGLLQRGCHGVLLFCLCCFAWSGDYVRCKWCRSSTPPPEYCWCFVVVKTALLYFLCGATFVCFVAFLLRTRTKKARIKKRHSDPICAISCNIFLLMIHCYFHQYERHETLNGCRIKGESYISSKYVLSTRLLMSESITGLSSTINENPSVKIRDVITPPRTAPPDINIFLRSRSCSQCQ